MLKPEEINDKTAALLYYGGGYSNGFVLDPYLIETYVRDYTPNCIGVFFLGSGWNHYENWCHIGLDYINKLANYCNIEIKNLQIAGSSLGGSVALQAGVMSEIPVSAISVLDNACEWHLETNLNNDQIQKLKDEGTIFYLYEQSTEIKHQAVQDMVDMGCLIKMIQCNHGDHDAITKGAFKYGAFSYAFGWTELPEQAYVIKDYNFESARIERAPAAER